MSHRTIITGATGFVGANLARRLLRDGHEVHIVARPSRSDWRIAGIAPDLRMHEADVTDRDRVTALLRHIRPDWVFHLAAYGAYSHQADTERIVATNVLGCMAMLDASIDAGTAAFVHTGSSSEYGYRAAPARECDPIAPNSVYAISKAAATHYAALMSRTHDLHAVTLRLYSIYGPYEEPSRLIPTLLAHARRGLLPPLVSATTARDYVYVDDAVEALILAAASAQTPRASVFNICSGRQTDMASMVDTVRRLLRCSAEPVWGLMPPRPWDTDIWVGDPSLTARELGWTATTSLSDGLASTLNWLCESDERLAFYEARIFREGHS